MTTSSTVLLGNVLKVMRQIPDQSVQTCVTSPPYYGLRDYGHDEQIGLEKTPKDYVDKMVEVFAEVWRVLRDDGTVWLNLGDSYNSSDKWGGGGSNTGKQTVDDNGEVPSWQGVRRRKDKPDGIKPKDLIGIPWMVAFALRDAGWYLRSDIIWSKSCGMPEAVTDRCTKSHEYVFLLSKQPRYYYDNLAIAEPVSTNPTTVARRGRNDLGVSGPNYGEPDRNKRSVWTITPKPFPGAHFAVMPQELVRPCILAGTSKAGRCPECGTPWVREVESTRTPTRPGKNTKVTGDSLTDGNRDPKRHVTTRKTLGWKPQCTCGADPIPCVVFDPFTGSGTTGVVAASEGRDFIGVELNPEYHKMATERIDVVRGKSKELVVDTPHVRGTRRRIMGGFE